MSVTGPVPSADGGRQSHGDTGAALRSGAASPGDGGGQWYLPSSLPAFPRLLFFDLDGTLLATGAVLHRRTIAAVRAATERGATIALATGGFSARTDLIARILEREAAARVWRIAHNGAAIWDPDGRLVYTDPTPPAAVAAVLSAAGRRAWATFEIADAEGTTHVYYAGRLRPELVQFLWGPQHEPAEDEAGIHTGLEPRWDWRRARTAPHGAQARVLGCWAIGTVEALASLDAQTRHNMLYGARYLRWGKRVGQILGRSRMRLEGRDIGAISASKGTAAVWLSERLGFQIDLTAAFGDSDNDLDMLECAGTAVAMGNATEAAKRRATLIAPSSDDDGVAAVLEAWLAQ